MYLTHVRHRVKDYATWRKAFDHNANMLFQKYNSLSTLIVQVNGDPTDIVIINTWPSKKHWEDFIAAHKFQSKDNMVKAREKGGVIGEPEWFGGEVI